MTRRPSEVKVSAKTTISEQDAVKLTGKVSPRPVDRKVSVQLRYDGKKRWVTVGSTRLQKDGSFAFADKPKTRLDRSYRVVKPGDARSDRGISRQRAVKVLAWDWLDAFPPSSVQNLERAMPINGDNYAHALYVERLF